jgi:hypothetical protein
MNAIRQAPRLAHASFCLSVILSENRFPSPIGVEDMLFGIMLPKQPQPYMPSFIQAVCG